MTLLKNNLSDFFLLYFWTEYMVYTYKLDEQGKKEEGTSAGNVEEIKLKQSKK